MLKDIEQRSGRRPEDKKEEKVCLDIDMLLYDNKNIKNRKIGKGDIYNSHYQLSILHYLLSR